MAKIGKKPTDDQLLEGGGAGAGISGTKYSKMPSLRGSSSTMGDLRKINKDTSNLRGNAKKVTEDAQDRAAARTGVRAAGAGAAAAGIKTAVSDDSEDKKDDKTPSRAGMGEIISGKGMAGGGMTEDDKKAAQYRKEAKSGGTDAPVPPSVTQEATDKKMQDKAKQAPTTKTDMGKPFAKGGMTASSRADGCATKGKTKGRFV
jgi:hypothetical protein